MTAHDPSADFRTPTQPHPAEVGRAIAAALATGGSPDGLRAIVCAYVRELKLAGLPPERALMRVKEVVGLTPSTLRPGPASLPSDELGRSVVEWFVTEYYRSD